MTDARILQIIREEIAYENNLIFEGVNSYTPINGYRNNQLIEIYDNRGKQLINEGMIDTVQSVLDYAGFIPGIGDLLDGINALIYMIRKKYFLGVTSLVATIPAVGSVIAAPFKTAHKLLGKAANKLGSILGDILGFITAIGLAVGAVTIRSAKTKNLVPAAVVGKLFVALFAIYFVESYVLVDRDLFIVPLMCVMCVAIPFVMVTIAPRFIPAEEVNLFFLLETIIGPFWVWMVIKEQPSVETILGGFIIILTIAIHSYLKLKRS